LLARCERDRPICCWVERTRRSASDATLLQPLYNYPWNLAELRRTSKN
jgi:hypothetical protein